MTKRSYLEFGQLSTPVSQVNLDAKSALSWFYFSSGFFFPLCNCSSTWKPSVKLTDTLLCHSGFLTNRSTRKGEPVAGLHLCWYNENHLWTLLKSVITYLQRVHSKFWRPYLCREFEKAVTSAESRFTISRFANSVPNQGGGKGKPGGGGDRGSTLSPCRAFSASATIHHPLNGPNAEACFQQFKDYISDWWHTGMDQILKPPFNNLNTTPEAVGRLPILQNS